MKKLPVIPPDSRERWLNTNDIAARLLIQPRTAALWARQGRLPAYRLGRYLRFKWDEVERSLAATCRVVGQNEK
jgi:excisionase family DNA binding protein